MRRQRFIKGIRRNPFGWMGDLAAYRVRSKVFHQRRRREICFVRWPARLPVRSSPCLFRVSGGRGRGFDAADVKLRTAVLDGTPEPIQQKWAWHGQSRVLSMTQRQGGEFAAACPDGRRGAVAAITPCASKIALPPCTHPAAIVRVQVHKSKDKQPRTSAAAMSVPRVHVQVQVYV